MNKEDTDSSKVNFMKNRSGGIIMEKKVKNVAKKINKLEKLQIKQIILGKKLDKYLAAWN